MGRFENKTESIKIIIFFFKHLKTALPGPGHQNKNETTTTPLHVQPDHLVEVVLRDVHFSSRGFQWAELSRLRSIR